MPRPATLLRGDAEAVADWLEVHALWLDGAPLAPSRQEAIAAAAGVAHAALGMARNTCRRRADILGARYPFRLSDAGALAARVDANASRYVALLVMSCCTRGRPNGTTATAGTLLEDITVDAAGGIFGPEGRALRFAYPSREGRPREFPDAIRWLAGHLGVPIGSAFRPPTRKDGGVDVVAWRPMPDQRSGFPLMLVQCTLEQDWDRKARDVDTRVWSGWLSLDAEPMTALAIPATVPSGEAWNLLAARTIVLERLRLVGLHTDDAGGHLAGVLAAFTQDEVARINAEEPFDA